MRRKEREVTDESRIKEIILACGTCRVALNTGEAPYIVPLSFGYEENGGLRTLYFHGAKEGRKVELMKNNAYAGFEMDADREIVEGETACGYTAMYKSVIGTGSIEFIEDTDEKRHALDIIMRHYSDWEAFEYADEMLNRVCVFKLSIKELSCKEHRK